MIDDYLKSLNEAYTSSTTRRTNAQKTKSTGGSIALSLARKANDPMYDRMQLYRHMYLKLKEQIVKKYKSKSMSLARQKATKYKKK